MHPVIAREAIQVAELERRQRLTEAERDRLIRAAGLDPGVPIPSTVWLHRVRDGLFGEFGALTRFGDARGVPVRDESAAIPSA